MIEGVGTKIAYLTLQRVIENGRCGASRVRGKT